MGDHPCIKVAGHSDVGGGIHTVGSDFIFDDGFSLQSEIVLGRRPDDSIFRKDHDAGVVIADAEFIFGADHAERLDSTDFGLFDLEVAREDGSYSGEEDFLPCSDVRGAADHGQRFSGTVIDLGDVKMVGIRMGCALENTGDNHTGKTAGNLFLLLYRIHLDSYVRHCISYLLRSEIRHKIVFKPVVR